MKHSYWHKRGQSLPLVALLMIILIAFVGLSVDVGNAYGQQRRMQNAANAGALAGANTVLEAQSHLALGWGNAKVWEQIKYALAGNRVDTDDSIYSYEAYYITKSGGSFIKTAIPTSGSIPSSNLVRIEIAVTERVDTYFARIIRRNSFNVNADGAACFGNFDKGIFPIGVPEMLQDTWPQNSGSNKKGDPLHQLYRPQSSNDAVPDLSKTYKPSDPLYDTWDERALSKMFLFIPVTQGSGGLPGAHAAWHAWDSKSSGSELKEDLTWPGRFAAEYLEKKEAGGGTPDRILERGDIIDGKPGVTAGNADKGLETLVLPTPKDILIPIYDDVDKDTGSEYRFYRLASVRIVGYEVGGKQVGVKVPGKGDYILMQYLGDGSGGTAFNCQ